MTKTNLLLRGFIGMFVGFVFSRLLIFFLIANGIQEEWVLDHHLVFIIAVSVLCGAIAILYPSIRENK